MEFIDYFLDRITMYRLVLYGLIILLGIAVTLGLLHILTVSPLAIISSSLFLVAIGWGTNKLFSWAYDAPTNVESVYITALILALIITPAQSVFDFTILFWAASLSMAGKYIFAIRKKHIFNPAAMAVVITAVLLGQSASWWIGTTWMMPWVAFLGFLIIRKLRFEDLAWSYFTTALVISIGITFYNGGNMINTLQQVLLHSSLIYLGSVMLTEPLTLPPTNTLQMVYGAIVGVLSVPQVHLFSLYFSPELALCIGNSFAYLVSPKTKLILRLQEKILISSDVVDFIFKPSQHVVYAPGQYMEWTLPHKGFDSRGNRRYFTLASSPTEDTIRLGVKFYPHGSSYKRALQQLDSSMPLVGAQLAGNFTLPNDKQKKLVFLAGGIGITPFRSMLKYLVDTNDKRDIILIYSNKTQDEIVYTEVFTQAHSLLGIKTIYTLTQQDLVPPGWQGRIGRITEQMIKEEVSDYAQRQFYLSGPYVMIAAFETVLKNMGVKNEQIKKDYFPGLV